MVNPDPLYTSDVIEAMSQNSMYSNPFWNFVSLNELDILAPRSNCMLDGEKANEIYQMRTELEILQEVLS